eukprot:scaffold44661_cov29-Tisochrysis_lutea.AAC.1
MASPASLSLASLALGAGCLPGGTGDLWLSGEWGVTTRWGQFRPMHAARVARLARIWQGVMSAQPLPASKQGRMGLRLSVQTHPGGVCIGGRGERGPHDPISFTDADMMTN